MSFPQSTIALAIFPMVSWSSLGGVVVAAAVVVVDLAVGLREMRLHSSHQISAAQAKTGKVNHNNERHSPRPLP